VPVVRGSPYQDGGKTGRQAEFPLFRLREAHPEHDLLRRPVFRFEQRDTPRVGREAPQMVVTSASIGEERSQMGPLARVEFGFIR
jgi:hypothetical protein